VSYREAISDPAKLVKEVSDFLSMNLNEEELELVREKASFKYMKQHESQFAPPTNPFVNKNKRAKLVRSGKAGEASNELLEHQKQQIDQIAREVIRSQDSDFSYETFY
jgi:hypothetical protein